MAKIKTEKVKCFYWQRIICRYGLPDAIVSDNGTQFSSTVVTNFCKDLGIHTKFMSVVHPQANRQAKLVNKLILKGFKKKMDDAKGLWAELLHEIIWSYHTTRQSTIKETLFSMVYVAEVMLPI